MAKNKYGPLKAFLLASGETTISLSLQDIAQRVHGLPTEANTPQFWANTSHHLSRRGAWLEAGYHAFLEKGQSSVRFERKVEGPKASAGWTDDELEACVAAYRKLWSAEQQGETLNKSALRRAAVKGPLSARSEGAYERRMQNISAILDEVGIAQASGYAPLKNVGAPRDRLKDLIKRYWKEPNSLSIITSKKAVRTAFRRWHRALLEKAEFEGSVGWLQLEEIAFRAYNNAPGGQLNEKVALSTDSTGENWVLQINIPNAPSTENGLSAIAEDRQGNLFLLRQGALQGNNVSPRIDAAEFEELSSIAAATVSLDGSPTKRGWFVVTAITDNRAAMRRNTAQFVELCARIRDPDRVEAEQAKADAKEIAEKFGKDEVGGFSTFWSAGGNRVMRRRHGEVWQALKSKLAEGGKSLKKPAHARGYETDGEVAVGDCDILLEIKTGCSAADVYTGVGQLQIYPRMLHRLANHRKILLLPDNPSAELVNACSDLGIELHVYTLTDSDDWTTAIFSQGFLKICGLTSA